MQEGKLGEGDMTLQGWDLGVNNISVMCKEEEEHGRTRAMCRIHSRFYVSFWTFLYV